MIWSIKTYCRSPKDNLGFYKAIAIHIKYDKSFQFSWFKHVGLMFLWLVFPVIKVHVFPRFFWKKKGRSSHKTSKKSCFNS